MPSTVNMMRRMPSALAGASFGSALTAIDKRPIAVSIATLPADGSFDSGTPCNLTQIAAWAATHLNAKAVPRDIVC